MRLYLAVAVLMLALVAYTEAQDDTVEQRFANARNQLTEAGKVLTERARTVIDGITGSGIVNKSKEWFKGGLDWLKTRFTDSTQ